MAVLAANVTEETHSIIDDLLSTDKFVRYQLQNRLNLADNTILIRLAIINLLKQLPKNEDILKYKVALGRPLEFDYFLKEEIINIQ